MAFVCVLSDAFQVEIIVEVIAEVDLDQAWHGILGSYRGLLAKSLGMTCRKHVRMGVHKFLSDQLLLFPSRYNSLHVHTFQLRPLVDSR